MIQSLIFIYLIVLAHELGHFVPAYLFGLPVSKFEIGYGTRLFSFSWCGMKFDFCLVPFGGKIELIWRSRKRWKNIIVGAGGPFANLICAIIFHQWSKEFSEMSLIVGLGNLLPFKSYDGLGILQEFRRDKNGLLIRSKHD